MKLKIKVREIVKGCFPIRHEQGDYFDLLVANDVYLKRSRKYNLRLGVAIELPKGMYAKIESRSSTYGKFGIMPVSSFVIDGSYRGNDDEWHFIVIAHKDVFIKKGTPICQFSIIPSQFSTPMQKLKWLLSNGIKLENADKLEGPNRGGIGSTDNKNKEEDDEFSDKDKQSGQC